MITIVSGLPRSGTSMLMQMLRAGGMELVTDGVRAPDASNPRGYFEEERVKRLMQDASWLDEAEGKAIKVIAQLLAYLPSEHDYRILFVERDLDEVIASQAAMLVRAGQTGADASVLRRAFSAQLERVKAWLVAQPNVQVCYVSHSVLLESPATEAHRIAVFLEVDMDVEAMVAAVDPSLYRQRSG